MLDRLLGKEELKREIDELERRLEEAEKSAEIAEERLEKAEERRKEAVSEKQEAEREANRLRERIEGLERQVESLKEGGEETGTGFSRTLSLDTGTLLGRLESHSSTGEELVTLVSPDLSGEDVLEDLEGDLSPLRRFERPGVLYHDQAGLFTAVAVPPVTEGEPGISYGTGFDTEPIDTRDLREEHVFCLVRSDEAAAARFAGGEVSGFRRRSAGVKSKHGKGGFSQGRFERLREEQVEKHLDDTVEMLKGMLEDGDFLAVGGDASLSSRLVEELELPEDRQAVKSLDFRDAEDEEDLRVAEKRFWETRVYVL